MSFSDPAAVEQFVTAGKAIFTLESEKTGAHFTYRVTRAKGGTIPVYFVNVLTGPNNSDDYTYAGILRDGQFRTTAKSKIAASALSVRAFVWFWDRISAGQMPAECTMHHMGACGRCGRPLTTPESVERGIGPECADKMGIVSKRRQRRAIAAPPPNAELEAGPAWMQ